MRSLIVALFFLPIMACSEEADPTAEMPNLIVEDISIDEGDTDKPIFVRFSLDSSPSETVTATIQTYNGTAEAGTDFEAVESAQIVFEPGDLIEEYRVDVFGDEEFEQDETFIIKVESVTNAQLKKGEATITLLNDDQDTTPIDIPTTGYETPLSYPDMTLIWQDEFESDELDTDTWTHEIGNGVWGWGNNESQYYREENTFMQDGHLVIEAREENWVGFDYTSSRIITQGNFDFQYGRVDIRAALPYGQGIWPALWMLGSNFSSVGWPACGEIDIMELLGQEPDRVYGTAHWSNAGQHAEFSGNTKSPFGDFNDRFHVFSIEWDETEIRWYMNDNPYHTLNITGPELSEFHEPFFFIFNVAVGGLWPGYPDETTTFPQRMIVDYVRVFQEN